MSDTTAITPFSETTLLRFARGNRLQYDRVREQWFIQAPERAFIADPNAAEVLQLIDGKRTLGAITDKLHKSLTPRARSFYATLCASRRSWPTNRF